ncbi:hypothetical protein F0562_033990 [Nyssa sinensis]|uniref:GCF C-terminal domain-containing protein n=1 Tax=Nyssa sinensis TaxID=561372 RepID=A0A5J5AJ81_9ASTE|nr:hypothetical protein F0562_033990 [Nyssa sinensis]
MGSRARNFRRRADDDDEDNENNANGTGIPSSTTTKPPSKPISATITATKPKKPQNQAPKKLLSFADDEENESPITRPSSRSSSSSRFSKSSSSSSHKITATKGRLAPSSSPLPSNVQPQAGTYTKEALLELQKNTKTLASSRPPPSRDPKPPSSEPVIVLKGLVKPVIGGDPISETIKEVDELEDEEEGIDKRASLLMRDKDDAMSRLASIGLGKSSDSSGSLILDQATINAIRAKRERLRQSRAAAPDYIALDGGSNHGAAEGLSDEEPEFQGRIALFGEKMDSGKKGVFEDVDGRVMDGLFKKDGKMDADDEDEEDKIWEEEQFRKALGKRMDDGSSRVVSNSVPVVQSVPQHKFDPLMPSVAAGLSIGGASGSLPGLDVISISQQAELTKKALHENLRRVKLRP